jgi:hypothetical protein
LNDLYNAPDLKQAKARKQQMMDKYAKNMHLKPWNCLMIASMKSRPSLPCQLLIAKG